MCKVEKQLALLEGDDFGWSPSLVCMETGTGTGFEDMMIDNWTQDGDAEIVWEYDIWSLRVEKSFGETHV